MPCDVAAGGDKMIDSECVVNTVGARIDADGGRARAVVHVSMMADDAAAVDRSFVLALFRDVKDATEKKDHIRAQVAFLEYDRVGGTNRSRCALCDGIQGGVG